FVGLVECLRRASASSIHVDPVVDQRHDPPQLSRNVLHAAPVVLGGHGARPVRWSRYFATDAAASDGYACSTMSTSRSSGRVRASVTGRPSSSLYSSIAAPTSSSLMCSWLMVTPMTLVS